MYFIVIDSHSKWIEVIPTKWMTASTTIEMLRGLLSSYGLPETIVSDNGPGFISKEFQKFTTANGIRHIVSPLNHPASNGAAERAVQVVEQALPKHVLDIRDSGRSLQHRLSNFLLRYRCKPHTVTGQSPAELFLKRPLRNSFSLLKPNLRQRIEMQQDNQLKYQGANRRPRTLSANQSVRVRNFRGGKEKWIPGTIVRELSPRTFEVLVRGETRLCHMDQLVASFEKICDHEGEEDPWSLELETGTNARMVEPMVSDSRLNSNYENKSPAGNKDSVGCQQEIGAKVSSGDEEPVSPIPDASALTQDMSCRYPQRSRKQPERLMYL